MAQPKLNYKNGTWYRNGVPIQNLDAYKFYNSRTKSWSRLSKDGKVISLNYPQKSKAAASRLSVGQKAYNYAHMDLAPYLVRIDPQKQDRITRFYPDERQSYYKEVTDSIKKRIASGFYDKHPEMYNRDHQMAQQYLDPYSTRAFNCIAASTALTGKPVINKVDFQHKSHKQRYWTPKNVDNDRVIKNAPIGSVIQVLSQTGFPYHSVAYMGNPKYNGNNLTWEIYNTHGYEVPFKNGSQIERVNSLEDEDYSYHPKYGQTFIYYRK